MSEHKAAIDFICGSLSGASIGAWCGYAFDLLEPIALLVSIIAGFMSIAWFVVRFWRLKTKGEIL